jgi:hypothetical protein
VISGIWLNTDTQGMSGKKIANENAINGADGEPSTYQLNTIGRRNLYLRFEQWAV